MWRIAAILLSYASAAALIAAFVAMYMFSDVSLKREDAPKKDVHVSKRPDKADESPAFSLPSEMPLGYEEINVSYEDLNVSEMLKTMRNEEYAMRRLLLHVDVDARLREVGATRGDAIFIRIFKAESLLEVWIKHDDATYAHLKDYRICAWSGRLGPKLKEGDRQSPEGFYRVYTRSLNPHSRFHLSFNLGFPNAYDRAHGRTGSYLMVHGDCRSIGCYAMTDRHIDEIYALVEAALKQGQSYVPVHIFPFRLDEDALATYADHRWFDFWMNLKEGYDYFEATRRVPHIEVENGRYEVHEAP